MSAGTKIFLAVAALFIGGVVIYYGVLIPPSDPAIERDDDGGGDGNGDGATSTTADAPAEFRNELPGKWSTTADRSTPQTVNDVLARDDAAPSWTQPRPALQFDDGGAVSDGGKLAPDSEVMGPPIPADYQWRTLAANTPITTTIEDPRNVAEQRIAAATQRPDQRNALSASAEAAPVRYTNYSVRPGDTLVYIAEDWFGDPEKWDLIVDANPDLTNPNRLQVGQLLRLPPKDAVRKAVTNTSGDAGAATYTVRSGDTLSVIAWKVYGQGSRWRDIYDANRSAIGANPDRLKVGMKLVIPGR